MTWELIKFTFLTKQTKVKPLFVKGAKSFMQIDKTACNRPLTLDCQVNSNPLSNITWYRRRLSRAYLDRLYKIEKARAENAKILKEKHFDYSLFNLGAKLNNLNFDDSNELYEDELVGTGPTYTIASFNCANLLSNLKNRTLHKPMPKQQQQQQQGKEKVYNINKRYEREKRGGQSSADSGDGGGKSNNEEMVVNDESYPIEEVDYLDRSYSTASGTGSASSSSSSSSDYESEYYYDYDETLDDNGEASIDFNREKQSDSSILNEHSDFGVYICEARNRLANEQRAVAVNDLSYTSLFYNYDNHVVRRYIKLNPIGPPVPRVMSSSINSFNSDEMMTLMMKISASEIYTTSTSKWQSPLVEVAASVGGSVTLTCLIEPLPKLDTLVWIKDNGKVIPNSRYSAWDNDDLNKPDEETNDETSVSESSSSSSAKSASSARMNAANHKYGRNFRVKNENLTVFGVGKGADGGVVDDDEDYFMSKSKPGGRVDGLHQGIVSTDGQPVGLMRSLLLIKNIRKQDFGVYKCKSSNSYGSRISLILLREKTLMGKLFLVTQQRCPS
jgi:hypothetical protein